MRAVVCSHRGPEGRHSERWALWSDNRTNSRSDQPQRRRQPGPNVDPAKSGTLNFHKNLLVIFKQTCINMPSTLTQIESIPSASQAVLVQRADLSSPSWWSSAPMAWCVQAATGISPFNGRAAWWAPTIGLPPSCFARNGACPESERRPRCHDQSVGCPPSHARFGDLRVHSPAYHQRSKLDAFFCKAPEVSLKSTNLVNNMQLMALPTRDRASRPIPAGPATLGSP